MHLNDEQVQRVLHDELDGPEGGAVRVHLAGCAACQTLLEDARREEAAVFGLLRRLDHAAPDVAAATVTARARGRPMRWRWAAGVALGLALAGAAYAAPGSPLPALVERVGAWLRREEPQLPASSAGIVVVPSARFTVVFATDHPAGTVHVSLIDGAGIIVRRVNGTASFTSDLDRLTVAAADSAAVYELELPREAPWVEVRAGARRLLVKDGARLITAATPDSASRYVLRLAP